MKGTVRYKCKGVQNGGKGKISQRINHCIESYHHIAITLANGS